MNSAIASVLNRVLGEFVQDLDSSNLNVGIFSGDISLKNVRVKVEALKKFGFPFNMKSGLAGNINVEIPWRNLTSKPLKVLIEDVYIFLEPLQKTQWSDELYKTGLQNAKEAWLDAWEAQYMAGLEEPKGDPGWMERTTKKIINNLQITINRVYMRFEDSYTSSEPFNLTFILKQLEIITCNKDWEAEYVEDATVIYKKLDIKGAGLYFDHGSPERVFVKSFKEYCGVSTEIEAFEGLAIRETNLNFVIDDHSWLMNPGGIELKLAINNDEEDLKIPKIDVQLYLLQESLDFGLEASHVNHILKLLEFNSQYNQFQKGVESTVTYVKLNQVDAWQYRRTYKDYRKARDQNQKNAQDLLDSLKPKELLLSYEEIVSQRDAAIKEIEVEALIASKSEELKAIAAEGTEGWFSRKSEEQKQVEAADRERRSQVIKAEMSTIAVQKQKILEQIAYVQKEEEKQFPEVYEKIKVSINFNQLSFSLFNSNCNEKLLHYVNKSLDILAIIRPTSMSATLRSQGAHIADNVAIDSKFDYMMEAQELHYVFEDNPLNSPADKFFSVRMEQAWIMPNLDSLLTIAGVFRKALVQKYDLKEYYDDADELANQYIASGQDYISEMASGNYEHTTMEIHINIKAPTIIIPFNASNLSAAMLVIDLGKIQLNSDSAQKCPDKEWLKTTDDEWYLYDKYRMKLNDMTIQTVWNCDTPCTWMNGETEPILHKFSFRETLYNCVTKQNNKVDTIKLDGNIPKLEWHLSDNQLAFFLSFNDHIQKRLKEELPADENPEPEQVVEEAPQMSPEQYQAYLEKIKSSQFELSQKFAFLIEKIELRVFSKDHELLYFSLDQVGFDFRATNTGSIQAAFGFGGSEMTIFRPGTNQDVGLLSIQLKDIKGDVYVRERAEVNLATNYTAHYFNMRVGCWEPLLEEFSIYVHAEQPALMADPTTQESEMIIKITSNKSLNINLSYELALVHSQVMQSITVLKQNLMKKDRSKSTRTMKIDMNDLPTHNEFKYAIKNRLGLPIQCWIELPPMYEDNVRLWRIEDGIKKIFTQEDLNSIYPDDVRKLGVSSGLQKASTIALRVVGFKTVKGIIIDDIGTFAFRSVSEDEVLNIIVRIKVKGDEKVVYIESDTVVMNRTTFSFKVGQDNCDYIDVPSMQSKTLPIEFVKGTKPLTLFVLEKSHHQSHINHNLDWTLTEQQHIQVNETQYIKYSHYRIKATSLDGVGKWQQVIQLHAPIVIQNLLPCTLSILTYRESRQSGHPIDIPKGQHLELYELNPELVEEHKQQARFKLQVKENSALQTDITELDFSRRGTYKEHRQLNGDYPANFLSITYRKKEILKTPDFSIEYWKRKAKKQGARMLEVYADYWIVNKTGFTLEICKKDTVTIPPNSAGILAAPKNKVSTRLVDWFDGAQTGWCKEFNISTVGMAGELAFDNTYAVENTDPSAPRQILLGVSIFQPKAPMTQTTIVHIVPRYIISNYLGYPIILQQYDGIDRIRIQPNSHVKYNIEDTKMDKLIHIWVEDNRWSSAFPIDQMEDFQIRFQCTEEEVKQADSQRDSRREESEVGSRRKRGMSVLGSAIKLQKTKKKWYMPDLNNDYMHFVRVVVTSEDDATIYVNFLLPKDPTIMLINQTTKSMTVQQEGSPTLLCVIAKSSRAYAYDMQNSKTKKLELTIGGDSRSYNFDKLEENMVPLGPYWVSYGVGRKGVTKEFKVFESGFAEEEGTNILGIMTQNQVQEKPKRVKVNVYLPWFCFSLIDDKPRERMLLTIFGFAVEFETQTKPERDSVETNMGCKVNIDHMQIDNMYAKHMEFPVIMCPKKQLSKFSKKEIEKQAMEAAKQQVDSMNILAVESAHRVGDRVEKEKVPFKKYKPRTALEVPFFQFRINKTTVTAREGKNKEGLPIESVAMEKFHLIALQIQEIHVRAHQSSIVKLSNILQKMMSDFDFDMPPEDLLLTAFVPIHEVCPFLEASQPVLSFDVANISKKAYFEVVNLGAIKILISFKTRQKPIKIDLDASQGFGVLQLLSNIGGTLINISESPLSFKELVIKQSFQTKGNLVWLVVKNLAKQGVVQFYKIIGSVDLIGNPIGLVDKLGSGVYEFFNEPRKGLLKGPEQFIKGVGKGIRSLLTSVVSGGFGSIGKITGSLYGVTRGVGGHDKGMELLEKPAHLFTGIFYGVKGGLLEIYDGVTGVVIRPIKGCKAKKKKFRSFITGMGRGALGFLVSPYAAFFRMTHEVTQGIANTATFLGKGQINLSGRFRFPRQFGARKILEPYDEDLAQAQEWLKGLKFHSHENIVYYVRLDTTQMIIMTNQHVLLVKNGKRKQRVILSNIKFIAVYKNKSKFQMRIAGAHHLVLKTKEHGILHDLYSAILLMPTKIDQATQYKIIEGIDPLGLNLFCQQSTCC